jgi:helix-turn-helix protein
MSIKVATQVWNGSQHKSGDLLVLLALADHADDQGKAWPGIPLLARKARLSERHTRRCLNRLMSSCEVEILPNAAPSGRNLYHIRLDRLTPDNLSARTPASYDVTPVSNNTDTADRAAAPTYIEEPSTEPSEQSGSQMKVSHANPQKPPEKKYLARRPDSMGLVSSPKNGF